MTQSSKSTDWLQVVILCLAGGTIFILPYLRYGYYDAMIASLHITNTQLGTIMAAYGAFTLPSYLIGGLLADRFSARNLLVFSFLSTALGGFYLMTSPAYMGILLVHGFWGISTVLTFWAAYFKIVRLSASAENQGKMFGIINGGRRVASMVIASVGLWIFARYGDQVTGFRITLAFFSCFHVVLAVLFLVLWKTESKGEEESEEGGSGALSFADIKEALRMPPTWFMAGIIFGVYGSYRFGDFFTPYLTQGLGIASALAGIIGTAKSYAITPVGSFAAGVAADKVGRIRLCMGVVVIAILCKLAFLVIPQGASYVAIGNIMLFMLMIWAAYTLIYAIMDDAQIPKRLTGTVIGVASCIGFSTEVTSPIIGGWMLDNFEGLAAFKGIFMISALHGVVALVFYGLFMNHIRSRRATTTEGASEAA